MLFGLPRQIASQYIRSLQTWSVSHSVHCHVVPRVAVLMGLLGIAMSGYSSRQLALHHRPATART
ncbi:hypothetical protein IRJ41_008098 [Triplophysa rosa]|uniref:Uncharacterized protein n=1 Tax=Triplophysa rosa TaxID=992332 RepID=A0A9W7TS79_TRIRA|nr:hypothetical protein IRJ41_008098 [Triplophysa rosa]